MRYSLIALLVFALPVAAVAQDGGQPLEITAQQSLEWDQAAKLYRANGGATAKQGDFTVTANDMLARYETNQNELSVIEALGNVTLESQGRVATGDKGVYDMRSGEAVLTGNDLKLTAPDMVVTAKDSLTYNTKTRAFAANGNANAVQTQQNRAIAGDTLTATFTDKNELHKMHAVGNVRIKAGEDLVTGSKADYDAIQKTAEVTGGEVTLTRGPNVMKGERATVDLNTNISRLFGNTAKPATAVFYPGSNDKKGGL